MWGLMQFQVECRRAQPNAVECHRVLSRLAPALLFLAGAIEAAAQQQLCRVTFSVEPASARVTVDHAPASSLQGYAATAPGRCEALLPPGDYIVGFSAEDCDSEAAALHIGQGDAEAAVSRTLAKTTGLALARSEPPGAQVTIDGVERGTTPCLLADLPLGTWQATFSLPGYKSTTLQFVLRDRTPVDVSATLASDSAALEISANIEGAEIKVNGISQGTAPCTVERVPAGDVVIEASAPGYRDFVQMLKVSGSERVAIAARMEELPASLAVYSIPEGARVYLDNNYKGTAPVLFESLQPGEHRIRVEKDGFDTLARNVTLTRGNESTEEFRLAANTGKISVTSVPAGVTIYVDGVKSGETPPSDIKDLSSMLEIAGVAEGEHTLKFAKPGYFPKTATCSVKRGETTLQRVELQRQFIPDYEVVTATGPHRGVLVSITADSIRIETSPGVVSAYQRDKVISHGKLK